MLFLKEKLKKGSQRYSDSVSVPLHLFIFILFFSFFFFGPGVEKIFASGEPLQELPGVLTPSQGADFFTYISGIVNLLIAIAAILSVIFIAIGGVKYVTTDSISGKESGKETITNALLGLLLALASWLILYTINPQLLEFNLDPPAGAGDFNYSDPLAVDKNKIKSI